VESGSSLLRPSGERRPRVPGAGSFGLTLFLVSLGVFFAAALIAYLGVRLQASVWPPPGSPALPAGLGWATTCILALSVAMQAAYESARRGRRTGLLVALGAAGLLALGFLGLQIANWRTLAAGALEGGPRQFAGTFLLLTVMHALHVLGGLIPLGFVVWRAGQGRYTWADYAGVRHCTVYWHFLGAVWIVLYSILRWLS
jgi:cytochrome c oxidase subunit 3